MISLQFRTTGIHKRFHLIDFVRIITVMALINDVPMRLSLIATLEASYKVPW